MTTLRTGPIVSIVAALTVTLAFGGCIPRQSRPALGAPSSTERSPLAIRFDNSGGEHVHVYLVTDRRQWLLGRVDPGAQARLPIPEAALVQGGGFVQLAVLTGERISLHVARDPRATLTLAQPASAILAQRWTFSRGQVTSLGR